MADKRPDIDSETSIRLKIEAAQDTGPRCKSTSNMKGLRCVRDKHKDHQHHNGEYSWEDVLDWSVGGFTNS